MSPLEATIDLTFKQKKGRCMKRSDIAAQRKAYAVPEGDGIAAL
jgi:hypothetical protein